MEKWFISVSSIIVFSIVLSACDSQSSSTISDSQIENIRLDDLGEDSIQKVTDVGSPTNPKSAKLSVLQENIFTDPKNSSSNSSENEPLGVIPRNQLELMDFRLASELEIVCYTQDFQDLIIPKDAQLDYTIEWARLNEDLEPVRRGQIVEPDLILSDYESAFTDSVYALLSAYRYTKFQCRAVISDAEGAVIEEAFAKNIVIVKKSKRNPMPDTFSDEEELVQYLNP